MYYQDPLYKIFFKGTDLISKFKDKFGKDTSGNFRSLNDITLVPKNGYIVGFSTEEVFYLQLNANFKSNSLWKLDFSLKKSTYQVKNIFPSITPEYIIIVFQDTINYIESLFIVWDMIKDEEIFNYSTNSSEYFLLNGAKSKIGYLMVDDIYINLDEGIENYYFECKFSSIGSNLY